MEELKQVYQNAFPDVEQIATEYEGVSGPLLISEPEAYWRARVRLIVIGQQTYGWPGVTAGVDALLGTYEEFDLGRKYHSSPFWQASHQLARSLNPDTPDRAFVWSNLVKVDQYGGRPNSDLEQAISNLGLLNSELNLLAPDVAVFFTGPNYDGRMRQTFPGIRYYPLNNDVARLEHPELPAWAFRTYHPKYLWLAKKQEALTAIADAIKHA